MRRVCGSVLVLAIVVLAACAAPAPEAPPLGGLVGSSFILLTNSQVREELKLSEDQVKKIEELKTELRQALASLRGLNPEERVKKLHDVAKADEVALAKILTRKQLNRVEEIYLQRFGLRLAFRNAQVAAALKITDEQKEKMDLISREYFKESRDNRAKGQERRQQFAELSERRDEKLLNLLTPAQKAKWKQLTGAPFKLEPRRSEEPKQSGQESERPALPK